MHKIYIIFYNFLELSYSLILSDGLRKVASKFVACFYLFYFYFIFLLAFIFPPLLYTYCLIMGKATGSDRESKNGLIADFRGIFVSCPSSKVCLLFVCLIKGLFGDSSLSLFKLLLMICYYTCYNYIDI